MKPVFVIAVLTIQIVALSLSQTVDWSSSDNSNAEQEIIKLEHEWVESRSKGDASYSENLLAADYIGITPAGTVQTKEEFVAEVKSGNHRGMSANYTDTRVRILGDVAVSTGRVAGVRYTRVYLRRQARWQLVAAQATPIQHATNTSMLREATARRDLHPCRIPGVNEEVRCGTYEVYEDRQRRRGRKIPINVVVLPALNPAPAPDPLFPLTGGPGQAATVVFAGWFADIRRERDIVLVDQRGTGGSNRLNCEFPDLGEIIHAFIAGNFPIERVRQCRAELEKKADLRFYTTPIAMDDLDEVRAWLGYQRINLYGGSYGTRPALEYLRRYPHRVRTVTLRAVFPQFMRSPLFGARDTEQSLNRLFDDCAKDEACAGAYPNLRGDLQTVLNRLTDSPARISVPDSKSGQTIQLTITRNFFAGAVRRALYDTNHQRAIPAAIRSALAGDFSILAPFISQATGAFGSLSTGMSLCVTCSEDVSQIGPGQLAREARGTLITTEMAQSLIDVCKVWPRGTIPADYAHPIKSNVPVLIFSGALDHATPPVWAAEVAKHLPNSVHIVMDGIAHSPFPGCASNLMSRFIYTGEIKGLDTSCVDGLRRPPFLIPPGKLTSQ
ncbi:MAG: alpha/beta fold hydrolase [Acidobacteria bacterium]|nr:alpha/beta fold hydrolase [Acidobacteriota bacterium]